MARGDFTPHPPCPFCGGPVIRRPDELTAHFNRRKACSSECVNALKAEGNRSPALPARWCQLCGKELVRGEREKPVQFRQRRFCDHSCARIHYGGHAPEPWKICVVCNSLFAKNSTEDRLHFRKRLVCSKACKDRLNSIRLRKPDGERWCVVCGALLRRNRNEKTDAFAARQTCGMTCGAQKAALTRLRVTTRQSPYPLEWSEELREAIRERDHHACRVCGELPGKRAHHVHHIDYVKQNCLPNNLITLCPSCHSETNANRDHWRAVLSALIEGVT